MLKTKGADIISEAGEKVILRGINLGNWMLIEPNMLGTAGTERKTRQAMEVVAGKEKTDLFFQGLLEKWITEDDFRYIKSLGFNSVRIPMNYRYFESDMAPFSYLESGFQQIDRLLSYCKKYQIYAVLDMHAAQGYQSGDWHCNNLFQERIDFYYEKNYEDRFTALWKALAKRYRDEEWIAGYDLLNEPVVETAYEIQRLNEIYIHVISEIRKIDPKHILFVEGNRWSQEFDMLQDDLFGENIVYSPHYYCDAAVQDWPYPGKTGQARYDRSKMEDDMNSRDTWIRRTGRPIWVGEFGVRRLGDLSGKNRALQDYLDVFEDRNESWCYWNFKDLRIRGPLFLKNDSAWGQFIADFIKVKQKYCADRSLPVADHWNLNAIFSEYQNDDFRMPAEDMLALVIRNIRETLANELTWTFAKRFAALSKKEIEELTDSFLFQNCAHYELWEEAFRSKCQSSSPRY